MGFNRVSPEALALSGSGWLEKDCTQPPASLCLPGPLRFLQEWWPWAPLNPAPFSLGRFICQVNQAAVTIQRWYRRQMQQRHAGARSLKHLLASKREVCELLSCSRTSEWAQKPWDLKLYRMRPGISHSCTPICGPTWSSSECHQGLVLGCAYRSGRMLHTGFCPRGVELSPC